MQIATKHEFIHIPIAIAYEMPFFYFYRYVMVECSTFLCYFLCQPMLQAHICTILEKRRIKYNKKKNITNKVQGKIRRKFIACENEISTNKLLFDRSGGIENKNNNNNIQQQKQSVEIEKCSVIQ